MLKKLSCTAVFDRRKDLARRGVSNVEVHVRLAPGIRKYIKIKECTALEWQEFSTSSELRNILTHFEDVVSSMRKLGEEMTIDNFLAYVGLKKKEKIVEPKQSSFLDFMCECINMEQIDHETKRQRLVSLRDVEAFGKIKTFDDLTPSNIKDYDFWLRAKRKPNGEPYGSATIENYHKRLHHYITLAYQKELIDRDPYLAVKIKRGHNKERKPLLEQELVVLRDAEIKDRYLDRVRDLFIFAAYTGLAYIDVAAFNYDTMTEEQNDMVYIDGKRTKTGSDFYTPILPPAMAVLEKYNFKLPIISNQKVNMYLHVLENQLGIKKNISFHVARHTFATVVLSYNVPIDKVARMLGHKNIKTTQIYAKILKSSVQDQATRLARMMM